LIRSSKFREVIMKRFFILVLSLGLLSGCVNVVSRSVLKEVDRDITFSALLRSPIAYKGKVVLLGGVIVDTINKPEGTLLEVYETGLYRGEPVHTDTSEGRFLALYKGYLDSEIYKAGRKVTLAGTVEGEKIQQLGEVAYHYPYLIIKEIRLWPEEKPVHYETYPYSWGMWYDPYPWGPWYDPWYPWGYPRYYPYWRHRHH
jgi:outer membrane lipoprotein